MKVSGNGQGKILTPEELRLLFTDGFTTPRDRALFGIYLFTGCRISEALALQTFALDFGQEVTGSSGTPPKITSPTPKTYARIELQLKKALNHSAFTNIQTPMHICIPSRGGRFPMPKISHIVRTSP